MNEALLDQVAALALVVVVVLAGIALVVQITRS